jgi:hypothetical protein
MQATKVAHRQWECNGILIRLSRDAASMKMRYSFQYPDEYIAKAHHWSSKRFYSTSLHACIAKIVSLQEVK